eukprot:UN10528
MTILIKPTKTVCIKLRKTLSHYKNSKAQPDFLRTFCLPQPQKRASIFVETISFPSNFFVKTIRASELACCNS